MTAPRSYVFNEYPPQGQYGVGFSDTRGRIRQPLEIADRERTKIIIIDGQSEHASSNGTAVYQVVSPNADNLNPYDGQIYHGADPVLGASYTPSEPSSMTMRIADRIISRGEADRVIMANIALGGTPWAIYDPAASGSLFTRIQSVYWRLADMGLEPDDIVVGRGRTDYDLSTSAAAVEASIIAWAEGVRDLGYEGRIWLNKFTHESNYNNAVRTGIENAIANGPGLLSGYDGDRNLPVSGGFRLGGGPHLSDLGLDVGGKGIADMLYPGDGNNSFTKISLPFTGSNGSTTITDIAYDAAKTWANHTGAISTALGDPAYDCTGGGYVDTPGYADLNLGNRDFVFDVEAYISGGNGTTRNIAGHCNSGLTDYGWYFLLNSDNKLAGALTDGATTNQVLSTTVFTSPGLHRFTFKRVGNVLKLFVDDVQEGGDVSVTVTPRSSSAKFTVGRFGEYSGVGWNGYLRNFSLNIG